MNSAGFLLLNFLTVPLLLAQNATTAQPDGMRILQMMSERYAGAKSWYIAATEERTSWNDYSRSWTKTLMIGVVSGNRYHFEAMRLPDESLMLNGRVIPCYAVRVRSEQRKGPYTAGYTSEEKLWIEKANWSVRKRVVHEHSYMIVTGTVHVPFEATVVTTYSTVALTGPVPESLFRFEPPQDAKQVEKFSDNEFGPDLTGQPAADVQLVGR